MGVWVVMPCALLLLLLSTEVSCRPKFVGTGYADQRDASCFIQEQTVGKFPTVRPFPVPPYDQFKNKREEVVEEAKSHVRKYLKETIRETKQLVKEAEKIFGESDYDTKALVAGAYWFRLNAVREYTQLILSVRNMQEEFYDYLIGYHDVLASPIELCYKYFHNLMKTKNVHQSCTFRHMVGAVVPDKRTLDIIYKLIKSVADKIGLATYKDSNNRLRWSYRNARASFASTSGNHRGAILYKDGTQLRFKASGKDRPLYPFVCMYYKAGKMVAKPEALQELDDSDFSNVKTRYVPDSEPLTLGQNSTRLFDL